MIIDTVTPPKQPAEKLPLTIDFTDNIPTAGSVSTCTCTSRNATTGVDTTATIVTGAASIASPLVTQMVQSGTAGDTHIVTFHATMSDGRIIDDEIVLPIQEF